MKLRKQAPAKAFVLAVTAGLLAGFFGLVKSEPRIGVSEPEPQPSPVNYNQFFAPNQPPGTTPPAPVQLPPHTRTRAS